MLNEVLSDAPLYKALYEYIKKDPARFHTPGHKASHRSPLYEVLGDALNYDLTELPSTGSLFDACGPILEAEQEAAADFHVKATLFSAGGATLCIQTMFALIKKYGNKVICARNIHRSAVNAMLLLGMEPVWVWPRKFQNSSLPGYICAEDIEQAFSENKDAAGVYLTSPDYYGVISDIGGIAAVCRKYGARLFVDNAHGTHFLKCGEGELHPLKQGACMTCDSAHKTLPVLTGGAYLQINTDDFGFLEAKEAMSLFGSTSPSYLIMLSLDIARSWMNLHGRKAYDILHNKVDEINRLAADMGFYRLQDDVSGPVQFDPVKIMLDTAGVGMTGGDAALYFEQNGVSIEMNDDRHVVLMPTPFTRDEDFKRLREAVAHFPENPPLPAALTEFERPEAFLPMREAAFSKSAQFVDIDSAAGRIAAEAKCPCPPGVPLCMPGEKISRFTAMMLKNYGVSQIKVV